MSKNRTAVAFDRVSSVEQKEGFSLEAQEKLGEKYARENNLHLVKRWAVSESASKEDERKHFFEMVEFVKEHGIRDVVFDKVDRACRGLKSAQVIEDLVEKRGVKFHFTREHLVIDDKSPSSEKLRFYLNVILAKYYIDNLKTEVKKGMLERQSLGYWNHKAPIGYKNVRSAKNAKATVEIEETTAPIIREMFELYSTGNYTLRDLGKFLSSRFENKRTVSRAHIEKLLINPFYYGAMEVKGVVYKAKHPPLISKELFDACRKIKGLRGEKFQLNLSKIIPKPYMGLMECGACRHRVTGEVKRKANGKVYVYYHCANPNCEQRRTSTSQDKIEKQLKDAFAPFQKMDPEKTKAFVSAIKESLNDLEFYSRKKVSALTEKRSEIKQNLLKLEDLFSKGVLSESEFREIEKIKQESLKESELEIGAVLRADSSSFSTGLTLIELISKSYDYMTLSENGLQKARLAKYVLSNPILTGGTLCYSYKKPFDVLIELTSNELWCPKEDLNFHPRLGTAQFLNFRPIFGQ